MLNARTGMMTVCIKPVPFCYGPSAIAIAVARQLKAIEDVKGMKGPDNGDGQ